MIYVCIDTNIPGGSRYKVDARFADGYIEFTAVGASPDTPPTRMDEQTFHDTYEPDTPPHN